MNDLLQQMETNTQIMNTMANDMHEQAIRIHEEIHHQAQQQAEFDRMLQEHLAASRVALGL